MVAEDWPMEDCCLRALPREEVEAEPKPVGEADLSMNLCHVHSCFSWISDDCSGQDLDSAWDFWSVFRPMVELAPEVLQHKCVAWIAVADSPADSWQEDK